MAMLHVCLPEDKTGISGHFSVPWSAAAFCDNLIPAGVRRTHLYVYLILVGCLEHEFSFHILGIIIPTDFHIFQRGRYTTNQNY